MKRLIYILILFVSPLGAVSGSFRPLEEESLYIRRIKAFWDDQEYDFASKQIEEFTEKFPSSAYLEHCWLMLGEIAFQQKHFEKALDFFEKIQSKELKESIKVKKWRTYLTLARYEDLLFEIIPSLIEKSDDARFYYGEACFGHSLTPQLDPSKSRAFLQESLYHFEMLSDNPTYSKCAKSRLVEIYQYLGQTKEAIDYYLSVANELANEPNKQKNEALLFHVALALSQTNQKEAKEILSNLVLFGEKKKKEGAYLWFYLLVKENAFDELIAKESLLACTLSPDKKTLFDYTIGKIYYHRNEFAKAIPYLETSLEEGLGKPYDKDALFSLVASSKETNNFPVLQKGYNLFKTRFQDTPESGKVNLLYACGLNLIQENELALAKLEEMIIDKQELALSYFQKGKILLQMKRYEEAYESTEEALKAFPDNTEMKRLSVNILITAMQDTPSPLHYSRLKASLERGLKAEKVFDASEKAQMTLLLAKCNLELGHSKLALESLCDLSDLENQNPKFHYLLALGYLKDSKTLDKGSFHGEKALELGLSGKEALEMHLKLFNCYQESAKAKRGTEFEMKAACHLYEASKDKDISIESRLWLIHLFTKKGFNSLEKSNTERVAFLMEPLLKDEENFCRYEDEIFNLSSLFELFDEKTKEKALLEKLVHLQQSKRDYHWKAQDKSLLLLASNYASLGDEEKALQLYSTLTSSKQMDVSLGASLCLARLQLLHMMKNPDSKTENVVKGLLETLHALKTQKSPATEPLHLEAAIDEAEFSQLLENDEKNISLLDRFLKVKEEFSNSDTPQNKVYLAGMTSNTEKNRIYEAYIRYLDARIYQLESEKAKNEGLMEEGETKAKAANALFSSLRQGRLAVSKYLMNKAALGLRQRPL